jgi:hypothetical protein
MKKNEIIKLLKPKCNGYDLPLSLNIELIAEILVNKQLTLTDVSQRSELYFAFMEEYNALMGKSEHQILKEEVIVLLAKYSG